MSSSNEEEVLQELKRISRLLALGLIENKTQQSERVEMLDRYGFQHKEIADLLRITPRNVSAHLSNIRKRVQKTSKSKTTKTNRTE